MGKGYIVPFFRFHSLWSYCAEYKYIILIIIAKNQLAREGSQSVSPVTIPALTTIVDRQFREDRTLCLVRP